MIDQNAKNSATRRVLTHGALGLARRAVVAPFYVYFERIEGAPDCLLEVKFNPEWVELSPGEETDVILLYGSVDQVRSGVESLIDDFGIELCPVSVEVELVERFFGSERSEAASISLNNPWGSAHHDD